MAVDSFALKISSRCNLNCSYCYVYNKGDLSWKRRPPIMPEEVFVAALNKISNYCDSLGHRRIALVFHGGEPTLIGAKRFDEWCNRVRHVLRDFDVDISIQTNGTLIDREWAKVLKSNNVGVGISIDGPQAVHDFDRVDHQGNGSYNSLEKGMAFLQEQDIAYGAICVVKLGSDPLAIHRHLIATGCTRISYAFPHFTHDDMDRVHATYGPTPIADFMIPIFDDWVATSTVDVKVRELWTICRLIMGGHSNDDSFGNNPFNFLFVESDGAIEGLDILRVCDGELYKTGLSIFSSDFADLLNDDGLVAKHLAGKVSVPASCKSCPEMTTCAGGYLPNRYSKDRGFDNPTVWCADILALFKHIRNYLGIPVEETTALSNRYNKDNSFTHVPGLVQL